MTHERRRCLRHTHSWTGSDLALGQRPSSVGGRGAASCDWEGMSDAWVIESFQNRRWDKGLAGGEYEKGSENQAITKPLGVAAPTFISL